MTFEIRAIKDVGPWGAGWVAFPFAHNHVVLKRETEYVTVPGETGEDTSQIEFYIPYPHRLCSVQVKHTTGTGADDTTALTVGLFQKRKWTSPTDQWFDMWNFGAIIASDFFWSDLGASFEFPEQPFQGAYRFYITTTYGHHFYYEVIFQILEKKGQEVVRKYA